MKRHTFVFISLFAGIGILLAADTSNKDSAQTLPAVESKKNFDLEVEVPITPGFTGTSFRAAIPEFELLMAKILAKHDKTRLAFGVKFNSRNVESADIDIELLDKLCGEVLFKTNHIEQLGPEKIVRKGPSLDYISKWDGERVIWLDLPKDTAKATAVRIRAKLQRKKMQ